jgi:hypothetical protein
VTLSFDATARRFVPIFALHVAEEAPGFTAWARRRASERFSQRDFVVNNALGLAVTAVTTAAVQRSSARPLTLAYGTLVATQQGVFNTLLHGGSTLAFREYSPGLVTSLASAVLWPRMTRAALAEARLTRRDVRRAIAVAGVVHVAVVARQVFFLGVRER